MATGQRIKLPKIKALITFVYSRCTKNRVIRSKWTTTGRVQNTTCAMLVLTTLCPTSMQSWSEKMVGTQLDYIKFLRCPWVAIPIRYTHQQNLREQSWRYAYMPFIRLCTEATIYSLGKHKVIQHYDTQVTHSNSNERYVKLFAWTVDQCPSAMIKQS